MVWSSGATTSTPRAMKLSEHVNHQHGAGEGALLEG
jgi:hypothetical protein